MNAKTESCVKGEVTELTFQENTRVTDIAKKHMQKEHKDQCMEKVHVQGQTLALASAENSDFT
jgi:hypothetical protein